MAPNRYDLLGRAKAWKSQVESSLQETADRFNRLEATIQAQQQELRNLSTAHDELRQQHQTLHKLTLQLFAHLTKQIDSVATIQLDGTTRFALARRGDRARLLAVSANGRWDQLFGSQPIAEILQAIVDGRIVALEAAVLSEAGVLGPWTVQTELHKAIVANSVLFKDLFAWLAVAPRELGTTTDRYETSTALLHTNPDLIDFLASGQSFAHKAVAGTPSGVPEPFEDPAALPPFKLAAEPSRRSVLFLHNCYYYFNNVGAALRRRGWDVTTVSVESPGSPQQQFYHGEDVNLFDPDSVAMRRKIGEFFRTVPERYGCVHFYGQGNCSFYPWNYESKAAPERLPWDLLELRRHNVVIGYTASGCPDAALPTSIHRVSDGVCDRCIWQTRPDVCSDAKNSSWIRKLDLMCDWIGLEGDWVTPERLGAKYVRGPVITGMSPELWRPDVAIPDAHTIAKADGEVLIYHAVGNYALRRQEGRDIKGTGAVLAAVERLKSEGMPVKLFFATDIASRDVRYYQAQADIIVDQLNYGRLGANARESLMLGRPLITNLKPGAERARWITEAPAAAATEETVYEVLRRLAGDAELRRTMAAASRSYALRWYDADACAKRFEAVIDRLRAGEQLETEDLYPPPVAAPEVHDRLAART